MIFKNLTIYSEYQSEIIKNYNFNEYGVNIILGEKRDKSDETNGVGKSTMIDCISFLLGRNISSHYQNNSQLLEKNIYIILKVKVNDDDIFLCRAFNDPKNAYILKGIKDSNIDFDLMNWEKYTIAKYRKIIESYFIKTDEKPITFASLREYIIRDEKTGYNDILLPNRSALKQYQLLNYLFNLPYNFEIMLKELRNLQESLTAKIKLIESMGLNIADLKLAEEQIVNKIQELDIQIEKSQTIKYYNENLNLYNEKKSQLNLIQSKIFEYEHISKQYQQNIDNLQKKVQEIKQLDDIENFYNELIGYFPENIKRNFSKVKNFYDFMVESRGRFFQDKISNINSNLEKLKNDAKSIKSEIEKASKVLNSSDFIGDISSIMDQKRDKEIELAQIKMRLNDYNQKNVINEEINQIQQEIIRLTKIKNDEFNALENQITSIQSIFNNLTQITYNQRGYLEIEFDNKITQRSNATTGRITVKCSIPDENSHGRLHMKINMFDLTWLLYRVENNMNIRFLIHDGSYSNPDPHVKGILLKHIHAYLLDLQAGQYFVTVNTTELLKEDIVKLEDMGAVCAKLDKLDGDRNRFFGFKF